MRNSIDITNEKNVIYPFAEEKTTSTDALLAKRLLGKIYQHLADFFTVETLPSTVTFLNKNKKNCRIIIYNLKKILSQKNIFVVIFYGDKRKQLSKEFGKEFFNTDWEIAMSMLDNKNMLCYASQELIDGNWFNIVLFNREQAKGDVLENKKHFYAAYTLAPKRFTWIRLHNALLPNGVSEYKNLVFTKTKYYNFDILWFATRQY